MWQFTASGRVHSFIHFSTFTDSLLPMSQLFRQQQHPDCIIKLVSNWAETMVIPGLVELLKTLCVCSFIVIWTKLLSRLSDSQWESDKRLKTHWGAPLQNESPLYHIPSISQSQRIIIPTSIILLLGDVLTSLALTSQSSFYLHHHHHHHQHLHVHSYITN